MYYFWLHMIPVLGSPTPPPLTRLGPCMPNPCDGVHFSRMAAPKLSAVARISSEHTRSL